MPKSTALNSIQSYWFASIGGIVVPMFHFLYGEGEARFIVAFLIAFLLIMDWIAGVSASDKDGSYASEYGIKGVGRSLFILMVPVVGNLIDRLLGTPGIFFGVFSFGLLIHIGRSAVANSVRSGWASWLPIGIFEMVLEWAENEIKHKTARALKRKQERDELLYEKGEE
ncbi:phage holin family protein [Bacillus sp. FJAT-45350]|uniref:phage holin family protein n=1 Tax=Bacillus sp. FJAT-45350 TaxID=2011014 RepID=UPI000BB93417|nr:phage holin family protein [Bacillus sp. FJAT-45350]